MRTHQFARPATILLLGLLLTGLARAQRSDLPPQTNVPSEQPGPDADAAKQKAIQLLRKNLMASGLNQSMLSDYVVSDAYLDKISGHFLVYLQQAWLNIPVYNKIGVYVFKGDTLISKKLDYIA